MVVDSGATAAADAASSAAARRMSRALKSGEGSIGWRHQRHPRQRLAIESDHQLTPLAVG